MERSKRKVPDRRRYRKRGRRGNDRSRRSVDQRFHSQENRKLDRREAIAGDGVENEKERRGKTEMEGRKISRGGRSENRVLRTQTNDL